MRTLLASIMLAGVLSGCRLESVAGEVADDPVVAAATAVFRDHCGACHEGEDAPAPARAVFDLADPDWHRALSTATLESAQARIDSPTVNGAPSTVSDTERAQVARFVRRELRRRAELTALPMNWRVELTGGR